MSEDRYIVHIHNALISDALVIRAEIDEQMSNLFHADIYLQTMEQIDTEKLLNTIATISIEIDKQNIRYFSGIIEQATFENVVSTDEVNNGNILYIRLVPTLARMQYTKKYRAFQEQTALDIVCSLLKENSITNTQMNIDNQTRNRRTFCVQYGESDFHFISRLMEEEGIFYCFEHKNNKDILQISDISATCKRIKTELKVRQYSTNATITPDSVYNVSFSDSIGTKKVEAYSYCDAKSEVISGAYSDSRDKTKFAEKEIYDPSFSEKNAGNDITKIMFEEENSLTKKLVGNSYCPEVYAGSIFSLSGSKVEKHNGEFLTISVKHYINQIPNTTDTPIYYNSFVAIPSNVPFRPAQTHFKNRIFGCQTALVNGTSDEEIFCDSNARIKVKFHWDSRTKQDENSSCWIRTAQIWAGNNFGSLIVPRVGMEVLVQFINGDPDQPIVVGCLYNGVNKAIEYAKDNKAVSSFRTNSLQTENGFNELSFNDEKDEEEIFIHAQKDMNLIIENSVREVLMEGSKKTVLESQKDPTENSLTIKKGKNSLILNEGDYVITLDKGNQSITLKEGNQTITLSKGNLKIDVTGEISIKSTKNISIETDGEFCLKSGKKMTLNSSNTIDINATNDLKMDCSKLSANAKNTLELIALSFKCDAKTNVQIDGLAIKVNAKATLNLSANAVATIKSTAMLQLQGTAGVALQGAMVKLN